MKENNDKICENCYFWDESEKDYQDFGLCRNSEVKELTGYFNPEVGMIVPSKAEFGCKFFKVKSLPEFIFPKTIELSKEAEDLVKNLISLLVKDFPQRVFQILNKKLNKRGFCIKIEKWSR